MARKRVGERLPARLAGTRRKPTSGGRVGASLDELIPPEIADEFVLGGYKNVALVLQALRERADVSDHELVCVGGEEAIEDELSTAAHPNLRVHRLSLGDDELRGAVAIDELLADEHRASEMGRGAAAAVRERLDCHREAGKLVELYTRLGMTPSRR